MQTRKSTSPQKISTKRTYIGVNKRPFTQQEGKWVHFVEEVSKDPVKQSQKAYELRNRFIQAAFSKGFPDLRFEKEQVSNNEGRLQWAIVLSNEDYHVWAELNSIPFPSANTTNASPQFNPISPDRARDSSAQFDTLEGLLFSAPVPESENDVSRLAHEWEKNISGNALNASVNTTTQPLEAPTAPRHGKKRKARSLGEKNQNTNEVNPSKVELRNLLRHCNNFQFVNGQYIHHLDGDDNHLTGYAKYFVSDLKKKTDRLKRCYITFNVERITHQNGAKLWAVALTREEYEKWSNLIETAIEQLQTNTAAQHEKTQCINYGIETQNRITSLSSVPANFNSTAFNAPNFFRVPGELQQPINDSVLFARSCDVTQMLAQQHANIAANDPVWTGINAFPNTLASIANANMQPAIAQPLQSNLDYVEALLSQPVSGSNNEIASLAEELASGSDHLQNFQVGMGQPNPAWPAFFAPPTQMPTEAPSLQTPEMHTSIRPSTQTFHLMRVEDRVFVECDGRYIHLIEDTQAPQKKAERLVKTFKEAAKRKGANDICFTKQKIKNDPEQWAIVLSVEDYRNWLAILQKQPAKKRPLGELEHTNLLCNFVAFKAVGDKYHYDTHQLHVKSAKKAMRDKFTTKMQCIHDIQFKFNFEPVTDQNGTLISWAATLPKHTYEEWLNIIQHATPQTHIASSVPEPATPITASFHEPAHNQFDVAQDQAFNVMPTGWSGFSIFNSPAHTAFPDPILFPESIASSLDDAVSSSSESSSDVMNVKDGKYTG